MSNPVPVPEKKPKAPRRPAHEVAAEYERRAQRIKWKRPVEAYEDLQAMGDVIATTKKTWGEGQPFPPAAEKHLEDAETAIAAALLELGAPIPAAAFPPTKPGAD